LLTHFPTILHSIVLLTINVISYWLATKWSSWTGDRYPSASAIPLVPALGVLGFVSWYHIANALKANRWQLAADRSWVNLCGVSLILGIILYLLLPQFVTGHGFSKGRLISFGIFQIVFNAIVIAVAAPQRAFNSPALARKLMKRGWFKALVLLTALAVTLGTLVSLCELLFLGMNAIRAPGPVKVYEGEYLTQAFSDYDPDLGKKLLPNADVLCRLKVDDETIWDVRYTTDEYGRRTTTHSENPASSQFAIFFGCSFLFGEGANDNETIPSQFSAAVPQFRAYNYGVPGYGTQHMLAKLESGTLRDEVKEQSGVVFYLYLEDVHEPRVIGGMQESNSFAAHFPYYHLRRDGKLISLGDFTSGRPVLTNLYRLLGHSQTIHYFGLNFPKRSQRHFEIVANIVEQSRKDCRQQLGCEEFYVVCFPRKNPHHTLIPLLQARDIKVLDYSELFDPDAEGLFHNGDGHPTPLANQQIAEKLAKDITN
jgi:hypothetical protein